MKNLTQNSRSILASLLCIGLSIVAFASQATVYYWDPEGTNAATTNSLTATWTTTSFQWSTSSSQSPFLTTWSQGAAACFCAGSTTVPGQFAVSVNSSNIIVSGIYDGSLTPPGYNVVLNGTGALTLSNTACPFDIGGSNGGSAIINCILAGSGSLNKQGIGTLTLNGANTYSGGTTATSGTLSVNKIADSGSSAIGTSGTFTLDGGTLQYVGTNNASTSRQFTGVQSTTSGIDLPSGNLTLSGRVTGSNSFTINKTSAGTLTLANTADNSYLGMNVIGGTAILNTTSSSSVHALGSTSTVGSGATLQLSGSGGYDIFSGAGLTVSNGGAFDMNGQNLSAAGISSFTFAGTGILGNGAFINSASNTTSTLVVKDGYITVSTNTSFGGAGNLVIPESIFGTTVLFTKVGSGTVTFDGTNDYSGPTTVQAGTLAFGPNSAGYSPITVDSGATLACATNNFIALSSISLNAGAFASFNVTGGSSPSVGNFGCSSNIILHTNIIVINVSGAALTAMTNRLMYCNGTLTGTANSTPTITGSGIATGYTASISTTTGVGGAVYLVVEPAPGPARMTAVVSGGSGSPANITGMNRHGDGTVQLSFAGVPNQYYLIQTTTNLGSPGTWTTLCTNQADANGLFQCTDMSASNSPTRYYRTVVVPGN